jgi:23S rRNA pseudouridine1911/1915/1917 synthase
VTDARAFAGEKCRLDQALAHSFPGLSRSRARRLIAAGAVFVNGRRMRVAGRLVAPGDRLQFSEPSAGAAEARLLVLYEDAQLIAVDKPAGMPSTPTRVAAVGTALETLRSELAARDGRRPRLWPVHRLDVATSGVLVFARDRKAAAALSAAFRAGHVEKEYVALVDGRGGDEHGCAELTLRTVRGRAVVDPTGKPARTDWSVIERGDERSLLRLRPHTGRMHQLRAHLAAIGHPVAGDRLYGGSSAPRLMLHASALRLPHPKHGTVLELGAPVPSELTPVQH